MKKSVLLSITLVNWMLCAAHSAPLTTAFTYQGRLSDNGQPANGTYDFQFRLFDAATNGAQVPVVLAYPTVAVSNGLFTTGLDFGSNVFNGTTWWLEISLRPSGTFGQFTFLTPRQPLTPTPNALFSVNAALAATATTANGIAASAVSPAQLNTSDAPGNGQVLAYNGTSLVWTNASTVAAAWTLNGNAGTVPGVNFLGTTDNQPLELWVNGTRALRLEVNTNSPLTGWIANIIGGASNNFVAPDVVGATISGGGIANQVGPIPVNNQIAANFGTISGGAGNIIQVAALDSFIGGGVFNTIQNRAEHSFIGGGDGNTIQSFAFNSIICAGHFNSIQTNSPFATIGGGDNNTIQANASSSTIAGGSANVVSNDASDCFIGGGIFNVISPAAGASTITGGTGNTIALFADSASIGGGSYNSIQSLATKATIAGGQANTIQQGAYNASIGGGYVHVVGTNAAFATIGGGYINTVTNLYGTVPGGRNNIAGGKDSLAAGRRSHALHDGTFVWADSGDADFASTVTNEFAVRATGGVRFVSAIDTSGTPVAGVTLPAGSGSWSSLSDRNAKANFAPISSRELLDRLAELPVQTWNYKSQNDSVRHIGPTAQDFAAAFHVGEDDRHIATVDEGGVALAAIQGLNQKLEERLTEKDVEIRILKKSVAELKELVSAITQQQNEARHESSSN